MCLDNEIIICPLLQAYRLEDKTDAFYTEIVNKNFDCAFEISKRCGAEVKKINRKVLDYITDVFFGEVLDKTEVNMRGSFRLYSDDKGYDYIGHINELYAGFDDEFDYASQELSDYIVVPAQEKKTETLYTTKNVRYIKIPDEDEELPF